MIGQTMLPATHTNCWHKSVFSVMGQPGIAKSRRIIATCVPRPESAESWATESGQVTGVGRLDER